MDSPLNGSRFSKNDSEIFRSTGTSLVFKTVGRNTKPSWSNRIIKDVNDLQYDLDIDIIGKYKFQSTTLDQKRSKFLLPDKKSNTKIKEKRKSFFSQQLQKILKTARSLRKKESKAQFQTKDQIPRRKNYSTIETYGLSSYEFKNTIDGRMRAKPNIHLQFDKKPQRKMDQTIVWYNPQVEIQPQKMDEKKYRRILDKYHPFDSYTDRKVFETKDKLDKVYETDEAKRRTSPSRIKRTVPLDTVPGRKEDIIKQSSLLSYETIKSEEAVIKSPPKYTIKQTPKQLVFGRQVINSKRGCYR